MQKQDKQWVKKSRPKRWHIWHWEKEGNTEISRLNPSPLGSQKSHEGGLMTGGRESKGFRDVCGKFRKFCSFSWLIIRPDNPWPISDRHASFCVPEEVVHTRHFSTVLRHHRTINEKYYFFCGSLEWQVPSPPSAFVSSNSSQWQLVKLVCAVSSPTPNSTDLRPQKAHEPLVGNGVLSWCLLGNGAPSWCLVRNGPPRWCSGGMLLQHDVQWETVLQGRIQWGTGNIASRWSSMGNVLQGGIQCNSTVSWSGSTARCGARCCGRSVQTHGLYRPFGFFL